MKNVLVLILIIALVLTSGCTKSIDILKENQFFFSNSIKELDYRGDFLFDDIIEEDVTMHIDEVANLKYGKLYELRINSIEGVPDERLMVGYFIVQQNKIYRIDLANVTLDELIVSERVPESSVIVCQNEEMKDALSENEVGLHQYIVVNGEKIEFHSYNNQVSTGYYETYIWEKNKGLIYYQSGFGAERDSIELELSEN